MVYSQILIPCLILQHWILAVVLAKPKNNFFMDSIGGYTPKLEPILRNLLDILEKNILDNTNDARYCYIETTVPKQTNGKDCGVFICRFAYSILTNESLPIKFDTTSNIIRSWLLSLLIESINSNMTSTDLHEAIKNDLVNDHALDEIYTSCLNAKINDENEGTDETDNVDDHKNSQVVLQQSFEKDFTQILLPNFTNLNMTKNNDDDLFTSTHCSLEEVVKGAYLKIYRAEKESIYDRQFIRTTVKEMESSLRQLYINVIPTSYGEKVLHELGYTKMDENSWPIDLEDMVEEVDRFLGILIADVMGYCRIVNANHPAIKYILWPEVATTLISKKYDITYKEAVVIYMHGIKKSNIKL